MERSDRVRLLQDRGTSPGLGTEQATSSKVGKVSDVYCVRKTTYYQPDTSEVHKQTEQYYLKDRNKEADGNFDLYDHVKKSFQYTSYTEKAEASKVNERLERQKQQEQDDQKKYSVASAPMTGFMPGYQQRNSREETSTFQPVEEIPVTTTKAETESEWETDEDVIEAKPEEAKLEDALAKLDGLDLDSDDEIGRAHV